MLELYSQENMGMYFFFYIKIEIFIAEGVIGGNGGSMVKILEKKNIGLTIGKL